jgi:urease accessory protein
MILVGIFAYQLGGRALWLVPLTFVSVMALGGFLGVVGLPIPFVEVGIALSVIMLGAIVSFGVKAPVAVAMGVVGLFAIFHGHAHGSEMPLDASGSEYGIGFLFATAFLHTVGIGIGFLIGMSSNTFGNKAYRVAGGLASVAGVALLFGYL